MVLAFAIAGLFVLPDPWRVVVLAVALVIEVGEVFFWIRFLRRYRVTTGAEGLIGKRGVVMDGAGAPRVRVHGEIWNARGRELRAGQTVRVTAVDGLTLSVEAD